LTDSSDEADVPSPIDLRSEADATEWAATAMAKRPWREAFFQTFVAELHRLSNPRAAVLELGSGPGFLAQRILEALTEVDYTALDFSLAMHALAQKRLGPLATRVHFVHADFLLPDWDAGLQQYDAIVTLQAVHELRHKRHAIGLYRRVRELLTRDGVFLIADHVRGEQAMVNAALYMSLPEHEQVLRDAGFDAEEIRREQGLVLYRAHAVGRPGGASPSPRSSPKSS
jgi:cyclopropane fatty-acyl-phospholipid synthase-like methyltransferase